LHAPCRLRRPLRRLRGVGAQPAANAPEQGAGAFVDAAETTSLVTVGLIGLALLAGYFVPRKPRAEDHATAAPAIAPEPAFA
jgi:hypothetical protein